MFLGLSRVLAYNGFISPRPGAPLPAFSFASSTPPERLVLQAVEQLSNHAEPFPVEAIPFLTNLVATVGWDANQRYTKNHPDSVVSWIAGHPVWKNTRQPSGTYPVDLPAFEAMSLRSSEEERGLEWFMAYAVASGFNPWVSAFGAPKPVFPSSLLRDLIEQQYWGLLEQIVQIPGAPSVGTILDSDVGGYGVLGEASVAASLVHAQGGHEGLARLLRHATEPYVPSNGIWGVAQPKALQVLVSQTPFPTNPKAREKIERKWAARIKDGELKGAAQTEMAHAAGLLGPGVSISEDGLKALGMVKQALGGAWGKSTYKGMGDMPTEKGLSAQFLVTPVDLQGTSLDGKWSPVAACFARNLREMTWNSTVQPLEYSHWLGETPGWPNAAAGALAPALGVEWRPGVSQDGVIALALLGRFLPDSRGFDVDKRIQKGAFAAQGLELEQSLFGIEDLQAFALANREAAVRFTEMALDKSSKPGSKGLDAAWGKALQRFPTWFDDAPELGARLLQALVREGQVNELSCINDNGVLTRQLRSTDVSHQWEGLSSVVLALGRPYGVGNLSFYTPVDLEPLAMPQRRLMAEMAIVLESPQWSQAFADAGTAQLLNEEIVRRFKGWHDQNQKRPKPMCPLRGQWQAVKGIQLNASLPVPSPSRSQPRF